MYGFSGSVNGILVFANVNGPIEDFQTAKRSCFLTHLQMSLTFIKVFLCISQQLNSVMFLETKLQVFPNPDSFILGAYICHFELLDFSNAFEVVKLSSTLFSLLLTANTFRWQALLVCFFLYTCVSGLVYTGCPRKKRKPVLSERYLHCHIIFDQSILHYERHYLFFHLKPDI